MKVVRVVALVAWVWLVVHSTSAYCVDVDPFDESSCPGRSLVPEEIADLIPIGESLSNKLGSLSYIARKQFCNGGKCGPWEDSSEPLVAAGRRRTQIGKLNGYVSAMMLNNKPVIHIELQNTPFDYVVRSEQVSFDRFGMVGDDGGVVSLGDRPAEFSGKITSRCFRAIARHSEDSKDDKGNNLTIATEFVLFSRFDNPEYRSGTKVFESDFDLSRLEAGLMEVSRFVYKSKAVFFKNVGTALSRYPLREGEKPWAAYLHALPRLFTLNVLVPVIEDISSEVITRQIEPQLKETLRALNESFDIRNLGDFELRASILDMALSLSAGALESVKPFVWDESQGAELEEFLSGLALIAATVPSVGNLGEQPERARELYERHSKLTQALSAEARTRGFGVMIGMIAEYLKGQRPGP